MILKPLPVWLSHLITGTTSNTLFTAISVVRCTCAITNARFGDQRGAWQERNSRNLEWSFRTQSSGRHSHTISSPTEWASQPTRNRQVSKRCSWYIQYTCWSRHSIKSLPVEDLLRLAHHPTSSRVFDVLLESPTVPFKTKRDFVVSFIGHYHVLVDDRIGSRVGDRCWAFADPYLRVGTYFLSFAGCICSSAVLQEKIARSLFVHEQFLTGSFYGKFFARSLNLNLLQRKPEEWKNLQSRHKLSSLQPIKSNPHEPSTNMSATLTPLTDKPNKRKRDTRPENEIDALFNASFGKRIKKGVLEHEQASSVQSSTRDHTVISHLVTDKGLKDVFGAIRAAPKDQKDTKKNRTRWIDIHGRHT